jgi:hypothetical protein
MSTPDQRFRVSAVSTAARMAIRAVAGFQLWIATDTFA